MLHDWSALPGAVLAALAAWRAHGAATRLRHEGLARLRWTFVLLGVAALAQTAQAVAFDASLDAGGPARDDLGLFDALFWLHHAAVIAAIALALPAHLRAAAVVPVLLVAAPVLRLVEAAGFLALTARAAWNHTRRVSTGSLPAAFGYLALTAGTATSVWASPLGPRPWWSEAALAVGLGLLWYGLPRRPRFD